MSPSQTGAIAVFVKTPGLSPIKTRLASMIGAKTAEEFHVLSAKAVEALVRRVANQNSGVTAYWAVAERSALSHSLWAGFPTLGQGEGALGDRLFTVYNSLKDIHPFVILLGADCPQIPPDILKQSVEHLVSGRSRPRFVLGRSQDGGFYLFGGNRPISQASWTSVPYSEKSTASELAKEIRRFGAIEELPVLSDIDTWQDLVSVTMEFGHKPDLLPEQRDVFRFAENKFGIRGFGAGNP